MIGILPILLAVVMEAAWISVFAGLIQEFALRVPVLGLAGMAGFVGLGVTLARGLAPRLPREWPLIGTALVFVAAIGGVLISPAAREALAAGNLARTLAANPGGMLAGLAVLRGYPHAGDHPAVDTVGRALFLGIPMLAIAAAVGGMVAEPFRTAFLRDAAIAAAVFIAAGLLTLAVAAVADVRRGGAAMWRTNPVWMALVVVAIAGLLAFAIPIGLAGGPSIALTLQVIVAGSIFPLAVVGFILGGRAALRRLVLIVGGTAFVVWILSFASQGASNTAQAGSGAGGGSTIGQAISPAGVAGIGGLTAVVIGLVVFLLIRVWMRRQGPLPDDPDDVRSSSLPANDLAGKPLRRRRRLPWTRPPRTAIEAYLALVEDLHDVPDIRRKAAETPSEHARRVRLDQLATDSGIGLELLAADYGLASYGARRLTAAETRRAIGRWRSLRRLLRVRPADAPARRSRVDDDAPPNPMKPSRPN